MKKNTVHKITTRELNALDAFLRKQTSDMTLVKAHGFITAVASFPELIMPSEWLPIIVGELKSVQYHIPIETMLEKLVTLYKQISTSLSADDKFEFILSVSDPTIDIDKATYGNIQEWCNGYCLALVWNEAAWLDIREEYITKACTTFFLLTDLINAATDAHRAVEWQHDKQLLVQNMPDLVKALYVYWLGIHKNSMVKDIHAARHQTCPCGSSKSYRNCCLIEATEAIIH